jgi:hypothetical protein
MPRGAGSISAEAKLRKSVMLICSMYTEMIAVENDQRSR